jgi:hypothetical protein
MRAISTAMQTAINSDTLKYFALVDIQVGLTTTLHFTDLPYSIDVGGVTYFSDGGLVEYEAPRQSSQVDRETFKITLNDNLNAIKPQIQNGITGKSLRVRLGIFDANETPVTTDLMVSYQGFIDSVSYQNNFSEASVIIEASSPMADLSLVKTMITSRSGMDQFSLTDTSFDKIIDKNESILRWGKK